MWVGSALTGEPEGVTITVVTPDSVVQGAPFDLVITVTDTSGSARTIRDIDFYDTLHDGVTLVSVTPAMKSLDSTLGFHTYTIDAPVASSGTTTVTFTFTADRPGTFSGDLGVSIDKVLRIHSTPTVITITPKQ